MESHQYLIVIAALITSCVYAQEDWEDWSVALPQYNRPPFHVLNNVRTFLDDAEEVITGQFNRLETQLGKQNLDILTENYIKQTEKTLMSRLCESDVTNLTELAGQYELDDFASCRRLGKCIGLANATLERAKKVIEHGRRLLDDTEKKIEDCSNTKSLLSLCVAKEFADNAEPFLRVYRRVSDLQQKMNEHSLKTNTLYTQCRDDVLQEVVWKIENIIMQRCDN